MISSSGRSFLRWRDQKHSKSHFSWQNPLPLFPSFFLKLEITQITDRSWPCLVLFSRWVLSGSGGSSMKGSDGSVANWRNSWPPLTSLDLRSLAALGCCVPKPQKTRTRPAAGLSIETSIAWWSVLYHKRNVPGRNRLRMIEVLRYLTFENRCKTQVGCLSSLCRCYASESGIWPGMVILVFFFK